VGRMTCAAHGPDLAEREGRGRTPAGVKEKRRIDAVEIEAMLDLQLEVLDSGDARPRGARDAFEQQRPEPVVAARVIAPAEDDKPQSSPLAGARNQRAVHVDKLYLQRHLS
jgi:hypothetical protein